mgnify:CR=1 FL=1|jgi:hypothetical protein
MTLPSDQTSPDKALDGLDREVQQVQRKIRLFTETGDLKRLARLRSRLVRLQADLRKIQAARPVFRKSYAFEAWCEELATGRKPFYDLRNDLGIM